MPHREQLKIYPEGEGPRVADEKGHMSGARTFDTLVPTVIELTTVVRMALMVGVVFAVIGTGMMGFSAYTLHVGQSELRTMMRMVERVCTR